MTNQRENIAGLGFMRKKRKESIQVEFAITIQTK